MRHLLISSAVAWLAIAPAFAQVYAPVAGLAGTGSASAASGPSLSLGPPSYGSALDPFTPESAGGSPSTVLPPQADFGAMPANPLITNFGTGGMQRLPGSAPAVGTGIR